MENEELTDLQIAYEEGYKTGLGEEEEHFLALAMTYAAMMRKRGENARADHAIELHDWIKKGIYKLVLNVKK